MKRYKLIQNNILDNDKVVVCYEFQLRIPVRCAKEKGAWSSWWCIV